MREVVSAGGVIFYEDQLLLIEHRGGYSFAKGGVEPGETVSQTAIREVAEETGRIARIRECLGTVHRASWFYTDGVPERVQKTIVLFLMEEVGRTDLPPEANTKPVLVPCSKAVAGMFHPEEARFMADHVLPRMDRAKSQS